jgi:hypothetical protein
VDSAVLRALAMVAAEVYGTVAVESMVRFEGSVRFSAGLVAR